MGFNLGFKGLQNDVLEIESHIIYIIARTHRDNQAQFYAQSNKKQTRTKKPVLVTTKYT